MPSTTLLEIPPAEQVQMRAVLRRTRYGYLLAFHILLLCAAGRTPTEIAAFLFCSRSSVYRIVRAYRAGSLGIRVDPDGQLSIAVRLTVLIPWLLRSLGAVLKAAPRTYGWCRTRWSCATLAATLQAKHGIAVSAETVRRWRERFAERRAEIAAVYDERFCRMWEFYLGLSELSFRYRNHMVFQVQLTKRIDALPITRDYIAADEGPIFKSQAA